jgi:HTH-type transcriptional regulator, transcriptional repressor of NAD biosynthesis genes
LPSWSHDEFVHIAAEQQARENRLAREANRVLICDTNAFATGTWHERYYHYRDARVDAIGAADKVDLYLLTAPDVAFVQDGFRDGEKIRDWMHVAFRMQLASGSTPWQLIAGSYDERFEAAEAAVEVLMQRHTHRKAPEH